MATRRSLCDAVPRRLEGWINERGKQRTDSTHVLGAVRALTEWKRRYNLRAGIEGTLAQCIAAFGLRQSRYRGLPKTHLQPVLTSTAMNFLRIANWLEEFRWLPLAKVALRVWHLSPSKMPPILQRNLLSHVRQQHRFLPIGQIKQRWPMTHLLDVLKETDLRVKFSNRFQTAGSRESLEPEVLQKRLLLSLYGLGTNMGLKRIAHSHPGETQSDLRYIRRKYIQSDPLRQAIRDVANATFQVRLPQIWGEATECDWCREGCSTLNPGDAVLHS